MINIELHGNFKLTILLRISSEKPTDFTFGKLEKSYKKSQESANQESITNLFLESFVNDFDTLKKVVKSVADSAYS